MRGRARVRGEVCSNPRGEEGEETEEESRQGVCNVVMVVVVIVMTMMVVVRRYMCSVDLRIGHT